VKSEAREKVRGELATGPRPRSWTCWHWRGGRVKNDREWSTMGVVSEPAQQVQYVLQVQQLQASSLSSGQLFTAIVLSRTSPRPPHPIASACSGSIPGTSDPSRGTHLHAQPTPRQALFLFGSFVRKLGSELRVVCGLLQLYYVRTCIYEYPIHRPTRTTS